MKFIILLGRLLFSYIFISSCIHHFSAQTIAYAAGQGVPYAQFAVPLSGALALLGGLSILLGFRAKVGAWLIVLFLVPVTLVMHDFWTITDPMQRQMQMINFNKNLALLGGALYIGCFGAGAWSIDAANSVRRMKHRIYHGHKLQHG